MCKSKLTNSILFQKKKSNKFLKVYVCVVHYLSHTGLRGGEEERGEEERRRGGEGRGERAMPSHEGRSALAIQA